MRKIDQLLLEYGESHQNATNKMVHWICVPAIMFSLIGMLWSIPHQFLVDVLGTPLAGFANFGVLFLLLATIYYLRLSFSLFLGMLVIASLMAIGNRALYHASDSMFLASLLIFAAAWVGQFIGHKIEGKKPSFLKDVQFLLIGPAWLLHFIYKKSGIPY
jgi:uncharacterized membrane protein YGL010W